jgi:hypothetical protein
VTAGITGEILHIDGGGLEQSGRLEVGGDLH